MIIAIILCIQTVSRLSQRYGGSAFPMPPMNTVTGLITGLMEVDTAAVVANPELVVVPRDDVGQGPLAKVSQNVINEY